MSFVITPAAEADDASVLAERARALAAPKGDDRGRAGIPHVVVVVGGHQVALPAARIRHVSAPQRLAPLPTSAHPVVGLAPILGQLVAVIDLGAALHAPSDLPTAQRPLVLLDDGTEALALLVDAVESLLDIDVAAGTPDASLGELTSTARAGVRVLHIDALLDASRGAVPTTDRPGADS